MNLILRIADDLAQRLSLHGDVQRQALEAFAVEAYRADQLTKPELRRLLGYGTRDMLDGFLKDHGIFEEYTKADLDVEREDLKRLGF